LAVSGDSLEKESRLIGDRYELEVLIGKGGVGEVWRARHVALNSRVAIKFLQPASAQRESAKRRFTTEAQLTAQLKTPHAVQVFDFGITDDGQPYLVMELLEGETLGLRLQRLKRLGVAETVRILGQAARALQRAHQLGVVHRDFKPDNIVIYPDDEGNDQVKVLDFGVAKLVGALEHGADVDPDRPVGESTSFTRTGAVLGTPLYMAPEQIRDATHVDSRVDIWALGVVAFECLTGRPPFTGGTLLELFARIQGGLHANPTFVEASLPAGFDAWFDVACAPDPAKRFPNAMVAWRQLATALDAPGHDSTPSLDPYTASGERRVLVVRDAQPDEEKAPTMDALRDTTGELRGRSHTGTFSSLQRISLDELPGLATQSRPPVPPLPHVKREDTLKNRSAWWLAGFLAVVACSAVAVWRVASLPASHEDSASSSSGAGGELAPVPPPTATAAATAAIATASPAPSQEALPAELSSTHAASPAPPASAHHPAHPALGKAASSSPAPSPPSAPPPATAVPPPADPGSYR
jgi:serine/threonine protein kinase